ncbi:MAG: Calx-beta domain-containing protein [Panacagrimonas sp.]
MDFNADGDWNDIGERIADHSIVMPGDNAIAFNVPAGAAQGLSFARVRLSSAGVDAPIGAAADGEVEDEIVVIGPASLSIGDVSLSEGNAGTTAFVFPVTLSRTLPDSVFVDFATETGTAGVSDFATVSGTLEIPAGSVRANITVQVQGDAVFEPDERFVVRLSDPVGAVIRDDSGLGTILNDEARPSVAFAQSARLVTENGGSLSLTVQLSGPSSQAVSVPFSVSGTASTADYSGLSASPVVIAAGSTSANINLTVTNDSLDEPNESLVLTLGTPVNADRGAPAVLTLTIQDDDDAPAPTGPMVFLPPASPSFREAPTRITNPPVQLSAPSTVPITVPLIYSGTATRGFDYTAPDQVTFPPGVVSVRVIITLRNDGLDEDTESIVTRLGTPTNARVGSPSERTLLLVDDDPTPVIFFNPGSVVLTEGQPTTARLRLNRPSGRNVTVNFSSTGGNANAPDFAVPLPSAVTIPASATGIDIPLAAAQDGLRERLERAVLRPTSALNARIGTQGLTIYIRDR